MLENNRLSQDELENVTGGAIRSTKKEPNPKEQFMMITCPHCEEFITVNVMLSTVECPLCHKPIEIKG
jgi:ribosomal protein S27E